MTEQIKLEIINELNNELNNQQLLKLKEVLDKKLINIEFKNNETEIKNNEFYVSKFICAKNIEGCSNKSLIYYQNTIEKFLKSLNKNIIEITTDNIREYLITYSDNNKSSKVTIDNIRRIFASFFS
ncbi:UNVERIFIED_CONTAM: phage integrase N-terminal SAM-like domain-containing protein [Campylobacter lari]